MSPAPDLMFSSLTPAALFAQRFGGGDADATALGIMCCGLLIAVPIGLLIGAAILRGACAICQVPEPDFLPAMGIVLLSTLCTFIANFVVNLGLIFLAGGPAMFAANGPAGGGGPPFGAWGLSGLELLTFPINIILSAV